MSRSTRTDYEVLLVELHMEMRAARGEDERADELRQEMDTLWHMLTAEEHAIFADLSEDLYILEGNRRIEPLADGEALDSVLRELSSAFRNVDFLRVLALLRKLPIALQAHHIFVMGRCWDSQGLSRAAVCFYDFANEAEPNAITELTALQALLRGEFFEEAVARAKAIEDRPGVSPMLILQAAVVLYRASKEVDEASKRRMLERVTVLVENAGDDPATLNSVRAMGFVAAGFAYDYFGDTARALTSFERAVAADPSSWPPLLVRGLAVLETDRVRAMRDFTQAAHLKTRLDWPYLYAALHALEQKRYAEVERFCEDGLSVTTRGDVRGRLLEWRAIAAAMLGRPPMEVMALFDAASAELPLDPIVRRNYNKYRGSLARAAKDEYELTDEIDDTQARTASLRSMPGAFV